MNNVAVYDNFLSHELYTECYNYAIYKSTSGDMIYKTNHSAWNDETGQDSNRILIHTINDTHSLCKRLKTYMFDKINLPNIHFTDLHFYFFTPECHMPWNNDSNHDGSITIYLNPEWNTDWGGALMYKSLYYKQINGVYPKQNRAIVITNHTERSVIPTTKFSNTRMSIQCFFKIIKD